MADYKITNLPKVRKYPARKDWDCPTCGKFNKSWYTRCQKCGTEYTQK